MGRRDDWRAPASTWLEATPGPRHLITEPFEPRNDTYEPDDNRWRAQVAGLTGELDAVADTSHRTRPVPGTKGAVTEVIVALGSAGAYGKATARLSSS